MLNHWACPDTVVMISINVYISSNSLRRGDRDGHLGNSRKKNRGIEDMEFLGILKK